MYLTCNRWESVVQERFVKTLKTKFIDTWLRMSRNVYIAKFNDVVNKYNNTYYSTIKMKPVGCRIKHIYWFQRKKITKTVQDLKYILQTSVKKLLSLKKLKILFHGDMLLMIFMVKISLEQFMKKNSERQIKNNLG